MRIQFKRPHDAGYTDAELTWKDGEGVVESVLGQSMPLGRLIADKAKLRLRDDVTGSEVPLFVLNGTALFELQYSGVIYSKKNNKRIIVDRRTGRRRIISSERAMENEKEMVAQFRRGLAKIGGVPFEPPYAVDIAIYEKNRTRRDLDNQATSVLDALVRAGVLPDDDFRTVSKLGVWFAGIDKENPRAVVTIAPTMGRAECSKVDR